MLLAIRTISGGFGNKRGDVGDENLIELDRILSPLTKLDIRAVPSELSTANVGHIVRASKALGKIFYSSPYLKFTDIRSALGPHDNCLVCLGFDQHEESA